MKIGKFIRRTALGALAVSAIPYQFKKDEQNNIVEIRSLLWGWKKTPRQEGEENDHIVLAIPASALDSGKAAVSAKPAETSGEEDHPEE